MKCASPRLKKGGEEDNELPMSPSRLQSIVPAADETGVQMWRRLTRQSNVFPCGVAVVDTVLDGGVHAGEITEIVGASAAGKTQLSLTLIAHLLVERPTAHVVYVDSNGSFRPRRLMQIIRCKTDAGHTDDFLSRVHYVRALDVDELERALRTIAVHSATTHYPLLIVDSVGGAMSTTVLGDGWKEGRATQMRVAAQLRHLAHEQHTAVVCVNHIVVRDDMTTRPALGKFWATVPHTRVAMHKFESSVVMLDCVKRSRVMQGASSPAWLRIGESGVYAIDMHLTQQHDCTMNATLLKVDEEGDDDTSDGGEDVLHPLGEPSAAAVQVTPRNVGFVTSSQVLRESQ